MRKKKKNPWHVAAKKYTKVLHFSQPVFMSLSLQKGPKAKDGTDVAPSQTTLHAGYTWHVNR